MYLQDPTKAAKSRDKTMYPAATCAHPTAMLGIGSPPFSQMLVALLVLGIDDARAV